jgi:hypothetical protein
MSANPKVFISYASEDREFVEEFASKLRSKGVNAWVALWEILPGDSLVDKIFEEGLKDAQAVIIILSNSSVNKPWVREELNASIVKRIEQNSKLIPVVIDDCRVPESLKSIVWEKINNVNNFDIELDRIVMSIYGHRDRPPVGKAPSYTNTLIDLAPGLTRIDSMVLKLSCEMAIESNSDFLHVENILPRIDSLDVNQEDFYESLDVLEEERCITVVRPMSVRPPAYSITDYGFEKYVRTYINDYDSIVNSVGYEIVNNNAHYDDLISKSVNQPIILIRHVLHALSNRGLIRARDGNGGIVFVQSVSPQLKRMLTK